MRKTTIWLTLSALLLLSACSSNNNGQNTATGEKETGTTNQGENNEKQNNPPVDEKIDPLGKYETPIEVTTARYMNVGLKFDEGDTMDSNIWYKAYKDELGIDLKNEWTVPEAQYIQKLSVAVATGEIPDILAVDKSQLQKLVEADMIEDLTEAYDKYASELTKRIIEGDGGVGIAVSTFKGKMMALPSTESTLDNTQLIWVRKDWLDKVGLAPPKTLDDVKKIAEAFVQQKPGGHPKTTGLALGKDLFSGYGGIIGLANGAGAYPKAWVKDESGKLAYGSIQPAMKETLGLLQEWFKAGLIDPEFGVMDPDKVNEVLTSGKSGLFYGQHWNAFWPLPDTIVNDAAADWTPYPIVSKDSSEARPLAGNGANYFFVVKKGYANPEALVKLMNFNLEKQYGPKGRDMEFHGNNTVARYMYAAVRAGDPLQNINIYRDVMKGMEAKSTEGLSFDGKDNYESINKFLAGDKTFWGSYKWAGENGALSIEDYYDQNGLIVNNGYLGAPTASMLKKQTTLDTIELETFTKIINNSAPLDEFDKFVDNWNKLGGAEITDEVNAAAGAQN